MRSQAFATVLLALGTGSVGAQAPSSTVPNSSWADTVKQAKELLHDSRFVDAEVVARRALVLSRNFEKTDDRVAASYFLLATVDRERQHCLTARANFSHAIAIWGTRPNPNPTHLFSAIVALINTDIECEDFLDARKTYRVHSVELQRYSSGPLDDAKLLALQAALERESRHYTQAEGFLRQALSVYEALQVEHPIESADLHSNLAVILSDQGRTAESLAEAEVAIATFEHSESRRPERVSALNSAACALANLGRKEEAGRKYQGALEAAMDLYGEENRVTAAIMLNYAQFLRKNKQSRTAAEMQKKGIQAWRSSHAQDNATVDVSDFHR